MQVGLQDSQVHKYQETEKAPVLFLEALAGTLGAVKEGKDKRLKERVEKQSYYDTLRKNGYTGQQAMEIIDSDKPFNDIGEPSDPRYLKKQQTADEEAQLDLTKKRTDVRKATETADAAIKQKIAQSKLAQYKADNPTNATTDQELSATRTRGQVLQLIKQRKYLDKDGFLRDAPTKGELNAFIVDKFPGKVDLNDPEIQSAMQEAYPDVKVKAKGTGRVFTIDSDKAEEVLAAKDAKGKPLFEKA